MRWRGLLGALGVVATLGATFGGASWLRQRSVARAFTDLRACLIGDPLAAGERVGDRLSAIEATLDLASGAPDQLAALLVLDFGTRVLLVWSSNGALRTRSAPLAELGRAPSRLLAAQLEGVMLESDMTRVDVLTRGERAVLSIPITAYGPKRPSSLVVLADASGHVRALLPP